jgi:hypothetical protein
MVQIHELSSSKHSYPKQALWIYFISSNLFLLLSPMSVSVDLFLFLYFQDDLEFRYVLVLLNWCYPKFVPNIIIFDSTFHCVSTYLTQHPHFSYTHLLDVLSFCSPTFCTIHHRGSNRRPVKFVF